MMKFWTVASIAAVGGSAFGQSAEVLYGPGRTVKDQGISLRSWGSGTISETDEVALEGTNSVQISTRNYFQGGIFSFARPEDLARAYSDRNSLLRLTFKLGSEGSTGSGQRGGAAGAGAPRGGKTSGGGAAGAGGGAPGAGGFPGGGIPGGGFPGGQGAPGAGGFPGGFPGGGFPGGQGGFGTAAQSVSTLKNMRFIVTTTDGKKSEAYVPVTTGAPGERGWRTVAIPLQAISGFDRTNKTVKEIAFSGDATTTFFVGDLRVVNDSTKLRVEPNVRTLNLAAGDEVTLTASGSGGASILKYTWDFDDKDGIQEDAVGQVVRRKFRKAGTYTITLTVSDLHGLKEPYRTTIKAVVNP